MSKKKFGVIIGGSGFIGGALLRHFRCSKSRYTIEAPNSKSLDLRKTDDIALYFEKVKPDFIVDAALASIAMNPKRTYEINYLGAVNLARIAQNFNIPFIHLSSSAVLKTGFDVPEEALLDLKPGLNNYTKSKLMCELTLQHLHKAVGLDYTSIRLGVVYGKHDHTIQGFHRLLFAIAAGTMPVLLCKRGVRHSYTYLNKIPHFVEYVLENRNEFKGEAINFVDSVSIEFTGLILKTRDHLQLKRPYALHMPLPVANCGLRFIDRIKNLMAKIGVETRMPPELMFLENLYISQTLGLDKLRASGFQDPFPEKNLMTELPEVISYYIERWRELNLISGYGNAPKSEGRMQAEAFESAPEKLIDDIHHGRLKVLTKPRPK